MADLQNKIKQNTSTKKEDNRPVSQSEANQYLQELDELSKDPAYSRPDSPSRDALAQAMEKARELHEKQSTRNEWGQLAEKVGQAIIQYSAASAGLRSGAARGQDMSNLNFGPGVDWESRQNRALKQYQIDLDRANEDYNRQRQEAGDEFSGRREAYGRREGYLQTALREARERDRLAAQQAEEAARERKLGERENKQDIRLELQDLSARERELTKQLQARQTLANQLQQEGDLSTKSSKKLQERYGQVAAQGDLDLNTLQQELSATDKPGTLWGTNPDEKARGAVLGDKVAEIRNMLDAVRARKQELLGRQPAPAAVESEQKQAPARDPQIEKYAADNKLDYEAAKKILVGRGYKPQE